jgi:hypothetical protein
LLEIKISIFYVEHDCVRPSFRDLVLAINMFVTF